MYKPLFFDVDLRHHLWRNPNLAAQIMMGRRLKSPLILTPIKIKMGSSIQIQTTLNTMSSAG